MRIVVLDPGINELPGLHPYLGTDRNRDPGQGVGVSTLGELLTFDP